MPFWLSAAWRPSCLMSFWSIVSWAPGCCMTGSPWANLSWEMAHRSHSWRSLGVAHPWKDYLVSHMSCMQAAAASKQCCCYTWKNTYTVSMLLAPWHHWMQIMFISQKLRRVKSSLKHRHFTSNELQLASSTSNLKYFSTSENTEIIVRLHQWWLFASTVNMLWLLISNHNICPTCPKSIVLWLFLGQCHWKFSTYIPQNGDDFHARTCAIDGQATKWKGQCLLRTEVTAINLLAFC